MPDYNRTIPKFYKNQSVSDLTSAVLVLDSPNWKNPRTISLKTFGDKIKVVIDDSYLKKLHLEQDLIIQKYNNQESSPLTPPSITAKIQKTYMATDENYLYIWIESIKSWKRITMSNW